MKSVFYCFYGLNKPFYSNLPVNKYVLGKESQVEYQAQKNFLKNLRSSVKKPEMSSKKFKNIYSRMVCCENGNLNYNLKKIFNEKNFIYHSACFNLIKLESLKITGLKIKNEVAASPVLLEIENDACVKRNKIESTKKIKIDLRNKDSVNVYYRIPAVNKNQNENKINNSWLTKDDLQNVLEKIKIKIATSCNKNVLIRVELRCSFCGFNQDFFNKIIFSRQTQTDLENKEYEKRFKKEEIENIKIKNNNNKRQKYNKFFIEERELVGDYQKTMEVEENEFKKELCGVNENKKVAAIIKKIEEKVKNEETPRVERKTKFQNLFNQKKKDVLVQKSFEKKEEELENKKEDEKEIKENEEFLKIKKKYLDFYKTIAIFGPETYRPWKNMYKFWIKKEVELREKLKNYKWDSVNTTELKKQMIKIIELYGLNKKYLELSDLKSE